MSRKALELGAAALALLIALATGAKAQQQPSETDLAKAAQNPVANMVGVPFQNNSYFSVGPNRD
jgi:hypothetical protein